MARPRRNLVMVRLSNGERLAMELAASRTGLRLAAWAREVLVREAEAMLKRDRTDW